MASFFYYPRHIDNLLLELLESLPAVMIVGPRACGKTTTARRVAKTVIRLDREREAGPFRDDPDEALADLDPPVLLDEWSRVPNVLGAVKRAIDDRASHPKFVLTGSARDELASASWAATGRVVRLTQWGLTERELAQRAGEKGFFDCIFDGDDLAALQPDGTPPTLRDYIGRALRGMFPDTALQHADRARSRWLEAYVDQLVRTDAALADEHRDPVRLRRYLTATAAHTAGVVDHKSIYDAAGVSRITGVAYESLFELLFVTERLPAWHSNRLNRLTRAPKRYLVDAALLGPLLGVDLRAALRDGELLGRLIDTFVVSQLRPEAELSERKVRLHHVRLENGRHEIDLLAEAADGRVAAIEIKSTASPSADDARHLRWLQAQLRDRFAAGVVFHTGPRPMRLSPGIVALPIASLWAPRR